MLRPRSRRRSRSAGWLFGSCVGSFLDDRTATLELGRRGIRALQPGGDRLALSFVLLVIAGTLAATQPKAAAMIQGAAKAYIAEPPTIARLINLIVTEALGEERARELRVRGADMDFDEAVAYTLTQTSQALDELQSSAQTRPAQAPPGGSGPTLPTMLAVSTKTVRRSAVGGTSTPSAWVF